MTENTKGETKMYRKLAIFEHKKENKNVCICFIEVDEDGKLQNEEIAILEYVELHDALKDWFVKYEINKE